MRAACLVLLLLLSPAGHPRPEPASGSAAKSADRFQRDGKMRGVCFVAGRRIDDDVFERNNDWCLAVASEAAKRAAG